MGESGAARGKTGDTHRAGNEVSSIGVWLVSGGKACPNGRRRIVSARQAELASTRLSRGALLGFRVWISVHMGLRAWGFVGFWAGFVGMSCSHYDPRSFHFQPDTLL